jgi:hypothetical protein
MLKFILVLFIILFIVFNGYSENNFRCNSYSLSEIDKGKAYLKSKKVAFCGLIRDGEERLPHVISKVEKIGKYAYMQIPIIHKMAIRRKGKRRKKEYKA